MPNRYRYRRGGRWPYNTSRWKTLRRKAVIEAEGKCSECGEAKKRLDAHHINPLSFNDIETKNEEAAFESEIRILCISCHSMATRGVPKHERQRIAAWRSFVDS